MATTASRQDDNSREPGTSTHLYKVGQAVRLKAWMGRPARAAEIFRITGKLPPKDDSPQYRIRSESEPHERVATQDSLELITVSRSGEGEALVERTFG